jgi:hypothetical protein
MANEDIIIQDPSLIATPAVGDSKIEVLTQNVVNIINDLASGLSTGSLLIDPQDPASAQEFRVQYAYEADRAIKLVGQFRRESAGVTEGIIDPDTSVIDATAFDALITARIKEYIAKITINDGQGSTAVKDANGNYIGTSIPVRPNTIFNEGLYTDLTTYYKEQILRWVSDVFMDGTGVKEGVDSLKELMDFLNDPNNASVGQLLNRVTELENRVWKDQVSLTKRTDDLEQRASDIETDIGSTIPEYTDATLPADHTGLHVRQSIGKEIKDRLNADKAIKDDIGKDSDQFNSAPNATNTVRGTISQLRREFETEKANSDANDTLIEDKFKLYKNRVDALNTQASIIGVDTSFDKAIKAVKDTRASIISSFHR